MKSLNFLRVVTTQARSWLFFNITKNVFWKTKKKVSGSINFHKQKKKNILNGNVSFVSEFLALDGIH